MVKVGSVKPCHEGYIIKREYYRQGFVFKDENVYQNHKDAPCYVPELSDTVYTGNDFLAICHGQQDFADVLFEGVDWQHPETLLEENLVNNEWIECESCGKLVDYGDGCNDKCCPFCGKEILNGDND